MVRREQEIEVMKPVNGESLRSISGLNSQVPPKMDAFPPDDISGMLAGIRNFDARQGEGTVPDITKARIMDMIVKYDMAILKYTPGSKMEPDRLEAEELEAKEREAEEDQKTYRAEIRKKIRFGYE